MHYQDILCQRRGGEQYLTLGLVLCPGYRVVRNLLFIYLGGGGGGGGVKWYNNNNNNGGYLYSAQVRQTGAHGAVHNLQT